MRRRRVWEMFTVTFACVCCLHLSLACGAVVALLNACVEKYLPIGGAAEHSTIGLHFDRRSGSTNLSAQPRSENCAATRAVKRCAQGVWGGMISIASHIPPG